MKFIQKDKVHPPLLLAHKKTEHSSFDNLSTPAKDQIRTSLLTEQGFICCYCMQRISIEQMKIEHWHSQNDYPDEGLEYDNLLGACMGGEGYAQHLQHCDTSKGSTEIKIKPTDKNHNCETLVKFSVNGEIYSDDAVVNNDLSATLNLNHQTIVNNRKVFLQEAIKELAGRHPHGSWSKQVLTAEIQRWNTLKEGKFTQYCHIVIYYLKTKIK
jgi:uncharacterized protein (TIGR02646 family)